MIGPGKSGSTSLYFYLRQHPDIFLASIKEPRFFSAPHRFGCGPDDAAMCVVEDPQAYAALFADAGAYRARGEMSPSYIRYSGVAQRIYDYNPQMKLFTVLRQPADVAFSLFVMLRRMGREPLTDFAQALALVPERQRLGWDDSWLYNQGRFYYPHLKEYFTLFPREQIKVYLYEDLSANPLALCQDLFRFLGVDDTFRPDTSYRHNAGLITRHAAMRDILAVESPVREGLAQVAPRWAKGLTPLVAPARWAFNNLLPKSRRREVYERLRRANMHKPKFDRRLRRKLTAYYREDILQLQDLIGRDLSHWLKD